MLKIVRNGLLQKYKSKKLRRMLLYFRKNGNRKGLSPKKILKKFGFSNVELDLALELFKGDELILEVPKKSNDSMERELEIGLTYKGLSLTDELLRDKYQLTYPQKILRFLREKHNKKIVHPIDIMKMLWKDYKTCFKTRKTQLSRLLRILKEDGLIEVKFAEYSGLNHSRKIVVLTEDGLLLTDRLSYIGLTN